MSAHQKINNVLHENISIQQKVGNTTVEIQEGWQKVNGILTKIYENPKKTGWWAKNNITAESFVEAFRNSFTSTNGTTIESISCEIDGDTMTLNVIGKSGKTITVPTKPYGPYGITVNVTEYLFNWKSSPTFNISVPGVCIDTKSSSGIQIIPTEVTDSGYIISGFFNELSRLNSFSYSSTTLGYTNTFNGLLTPMNSETYSFTAGSTSYTTQLSSNTATLLSVSFTMKPYYILNEASSVIPVPLEVKQIDQRGTGTNVSNSNSFTINKKLQCIFGAKGVAIGWSGSSSIKVIDSNGTALKAASNNVSSFQETDINFYGLFLILEPGTYQIILSATANTLNTSTSDTRVSTSLYFNSNSPKLGIAYEVD